MASINVFPNGSAASPSIYWHNDQDSGFFYDDTTDEIGVAINGVEVTRFSAKGVSPINRNYTPMIWAGGQVPLLGTTGSNIAVGATGVFWVSELWLPHGMVINGLRVVNGGTAATTKLRVGLWSAAGVLLASSAAAGVTMSGTNALQSHAFSTPYDAVGPAKYYVGIVSDGGGSSTVQMHPFGSHNAGTGTGMTFGSFSALTVPTTFTADKGPYCHIY